jgi:hypothetical protein
MLQWGVKTFELYDKDLKGPSKSRETVPLRTHKIVVFNAKFRDVFQ